MEKFCKPFTRLFPKHEVHRLEKQTATAACKLYIIARLSQPLLVHRGDWLDRSMNPGAFSELGVLSADSLASSTHRCATYRAYIQSAEQFVSAIVVTYGRLLTYGRLGLALGLGGLEFLHDGRVEGGPGEPAAETAPASLLVVTRTL